MDAVLLVPLGCMVGTLICGRFAACIGMLIEALRTTNIAAPRWLAILAFLFNPGTWLLVGAVVFVVWFFRSPNPPAWCYSLLQGFAVAPVVFAIFMLSTLWRIRRAKKHAGPRA